MAPSSGQCNYDWVHLLVFKSWAYTSVLTNISEQWNKNFKVQWFLTTGTHGHARSILMPYSWLEFPLLTHHTLLLAMATHKQPNNHLIFFFWLHICTFTHTFREAVFLLQLLFLVSPKRGWVPFWIWFL